MCNAILDVTNGTERVSLLGLNLMDWTPLLSPWKGGGIWTGSPFTDGSRLVNRNFDNTQDAFTLSPSGLNQDNVIEKVRLLIRLLEQAVSYWTTEWQNQPVWIEARGEQETNIRYATIHGYSIPELDNPYQPPFAAEALVTMENFTLILSHNLWMSMPSGQGECVPINNQQDWVAYVVPTDPTILLSEDSAVYRCERYEPVVYSTPGKIGMDVGTPRAYIRYCTALRFRNVQVDKGSTIATTSAYLEVASAATYTPASSTLLRITALRGKAFPLNPGYSENDYLAMPRLSTVLTFTVTGGWTNNAYYSIAGGMGGLLTEVFAQDTWEKGDDLVIFIECSLSATASMRTFQLTGNLPRINFSGILNNGEIVGGQCDTCEYLAVANKHNKAQISFIRKSDNVSATSDYLPFIGCIDNQTVWLNVFGTQAIGLNSYMAFCCMSVNGGINIPNSGAFNSLVFHVSYQLQGGGTWDGKWQYWNGAWTDLPNVVDTSDGFKVSGLNIVAWTPPVDWVTTVLIETGWWVRYLVTSTPSANTFGPNLVYFDPYTVVTPFVEISGENAKGDVAALARTFIKAIQTSVVASPPGHLYDDLYLAVRSLKRGADFSAYLNFSDEQNPVGVACTAIAPCAFMDTPAIMVYQTPTDRTIQWNPAAATALANRSSFTFQDTIARQYKGTFAVFARYYIDGGGIEDFTGRLVYSFGGSQLTTEEVIFTKGYPCVYMGNIVLGTPTTPEEYTDVHYIWLQLANSATASWGDIYLIDLVILPLDEFTVHVDSDAYLPSASGMDSIAVDSIRYPKRILRVLKFDESRNVILGSLNYYANKGWMQQSSSQRIWLFGLYGSDMPVLVKQEASFRYLGMRGKS